MQQRADAALVRAPVAGSNSAGVNGCVHFRGEVGDEDVGGRVQVALVVTADELPVLGERHVALQDARAHARARLVALLGVLGELQRAAAAVADRERRLLERAVAARSSGLLSGLGLILSTR